LYTPLHTMIINKRIKGVEINKAVSAPHRYHSINDWYVNTKFKLKLGD